MAGERLARSGFVSLLGSAVAALAALALTAIVGNVLGAGGTGMFFQAVGVFTILTQVLRLGTNSGIVRFISEQRAFSQVGAEWRIVGLALLPVLVLSSICSVLVWVFSEDLARLLAGSQSQQSLAELLRVMSPFISFGAVIGVLQIAARMLRGVTAFTLLQSVLLPVSRLGTVALAMLGAATVWITVEAWLWPIPFWLVITLLVVAAPLVRDFRRRRETDHDRRPTFRRFWRFNAPRAISSGLEAALEWSDILIVAAVGSPAAAGIYAVVTRAVRAGGIVDKAMRVAVAPTTSAMLARGQKEESSRLHTEVVRTMILLNWPFYLLLISMGGSVLLLFGDQFTSGWGPMTLLAAAMMFQTAAGMLQSILLQGGRSSWQMYNKAVALVLSIGGNLLLVPTFGLWGAAVTWVAVIALDNLIAGYQVHRLMSVHLRPLQLLFPALVPVVVYGLGGAAFTAWAGVSVPALLVAAATLSGLYAAILWVLRRRLRLQRLWRKIPLIGPYA